MVAIVVGRWRRNFAAAGESLVPVLLGELAAQLRAPIPGNQELVVYCWPLGRDGRKLFGETAIADRSGVVLACSRSVWIELAGYKKGPER